MVTEDSLTPVSIQSSLPSPVPSLQSVCALPSGTCLTSAVLLFVSMGCAWADVGMQGERCGHCAGGKRSQL